jgi:hypothetical protein
MSTSLLPGTAYEGIVALVPNTPVASYYAETPESLHEAMKDIMANSLIKTTVLNVMIDPVAGRKKQAFDWLTRPDSAPKPKL